MHRSCTLSAKNADGTYDFTKHFENMADIFKAADLAVISQDTVLGGIELGATSTETGIFNTAVELADGMADAGINVVLAANNHIMDEGSAGLNTMMSYFSTKYPNITLLGVNNSREAKDEPVYVEANNIKIAMINYSYGSNQTADLDASPYLLNQYDEDWLSDILKQAREEADFIIAFPFWGEQNSMDYTQEQERQALNRAQQEQQRQELRLRTEHAALLAPCDGTVLYVAHPTGGSAQAGSTALVLARTDALVLQGEYLSQSLVESADGVWALVGDGRAELEYLPMDEQEYVSLLLSGEEMTSRFAFANGVPEGVRAGDYAAVVVKTAQRQDVLWLPPGALCRDAAGEYVYIPGENGGKVRQDVKTGARTTTAVEITQGLSEGDVVYVQ